MKTKLFAALGAGALVLAASQTAMAGVAVGLNIGVPAPVYVAPAPVYAPPPVYVAPRPVYVAPPPVRVAYAPAVVIGWHGDRYWDGHRWYGRREWNAHRRWY
ncbi:hypothetical protein [Paraburkholderia sp. J41]|uniref:hypothetical protein n=1 Tax=Paraburkholderia sp. J41 TaxID=2805433 RepID=UPI002AC34707|nr:hypothetical protein [Paraburkholderia sp. J41]